MIDWVGDKVLKLEVLWDQSGGNPITFVVGVLNALGAWALDTLDALSKLFEWDDVVATRDALLDGLGQMPVAVNGALEQIKTLVDGWFVGKEDDVKAYFKTAKESLAGLTFDAVRLRPDGFLA